VSCKSEPTFKLNRKGLILGLLGFAAFCAFFISRGIGEVLGLLREAGWLLVPLALWHLVPLAFDTLAWRSVLRGENGQRIGLARLFGIRWTGESINALLPVFSIGGEVYKLSRVTAHSIALTSAAASIVVDTTLALLSEILFVVCGIAVLASLHDNASLPQGLAAGVAIAATVAALVFVVQRGHLFEQLARVLAKIGLGEAWLKQLGNLRQLDARIHALHQDPVALFRCFLARFAAWTLGTGEVWLGLQVLGHPISLLEAFALESLCQAVRTAGFAVPGALGVQEGGYILIGRYFGLDDSTALALSLARRVRDLVLGVPALAVWQFSASKRLLGKKPSEKV